MTARELLADLIREGVQLRADSDQLIIRAPKGVLTPTQRTMLAQHKATILALLREHTREPLSLCPLSHGQKALWFLYQLAPQSTAYNIMQMSRLRSDIDTQALRHAFQALSDRHPCLRTTYTVINGEPAQLVHERMEVHFEVAEASTWSWDDLHARMATAADRPFDLDREQVLRVNLFNRSGQEHILLLTIHHIAFDFLSLDILIHELRALYTAAKRHTQVSLPSLPLQYPDYVRWQAEMLASPQGEQLRAYWQKQLAGELPVLNLPTDRPRPAVQTYRGASHAFTMSENLTRQLKALAKAEGATLYTTVLAAFQVLLYRYTAQEDILVGSPMAGRSRPEFAGIIGYFVNPVVLRADLSGIPTFKAFLGQLRDTVVAALEHADYPFPLLVERLQPTRDPSRSPLFQVALVWDKLRLLPKVHEGSSSMAGEAMAQLDVNELEMELIAGGQRGADFDLVLMILEEEKSLSSSWKYNTDLFDAATIARMAGHFQTLLEGIVAHPEQHISTLPILTEAERHQLLVEWNSPQTPYPKDTCIHRLFEAQVERTPDTVAVVSEETLLTYQELNRRANQLAHYLRALGVRPEVRVGICVERSLEMIIGLLGILKAGGAYVPLDPAYSKERLALMVEDAQVPVLLTQQGLVERLPEYRAHVVCLDTSWGALAGESEENPVSGVTADNLAYVIYTSGTTGTPKGVMIHHRSLVNYVETATVEFALAPGDRVLQFASISFDTAVEEILPCLLRGAGLVLRTDAMLDSVPVFLQKCREWDLTVLDLPTAYWHELMVQLDRASLDLPMLLRLVVIGGERVLGERLAKWHRQVGQRVPLLNTYGPTETCVVATMCDLTNFAEADATSREVPIGHPIHNVQIYLLDRHLQPVPVGVSGEIYIGGVGVARGYLGRPPLTAEKFIPDPFRDEPGARLYKTGDLARYRPDRTLEFLGRLDHQVKIRGFRIELEEIEALLGQHPGIQETVVIAREDVAGDKRLVAYVVTDQDSPPSSDALRGFLQEKLPGYMVPSTFVRLDALPLTPNGKVDRRALLARDQARPTPEKAFVAPRTPLESLIAEIWQDVLSVDRVGVHDNFFDLGGHSLLSMQVIARLEKQIGLRLNPREMILPTLAQLASSCEERVDLLQPPEPVRFTNRLFHTIKNAVSRMTGEPR